VELNERSIAQIQPGSSMEMDHLIAQIPSGSHSVRNSGLWKGNYNLFSSTEILLMMKPGVTV